MVVSDVMINGYMHKHHSTPSKKQPCGYKNILQQQDLQPVYENSKYKIQETRKLFTNIDNATIKCDYDNNSESDNSEDELESCDDYNEEENDDCGSESDDSDISDVSDTKVIE